MLSLSNTAANKLCESLPNEIILKIMKNFNNNERLFPTVVYLDPSINYKTCNDKIEYVKSLFIFIYQIYTNYENKVDSIANKYIDKLNDLEDYFYDCVEDMISCIYDVENFGTEDCNLLDLDQVLELPIEEIIKFISDNSKCIVEYGDLSLGIFFDIFQKGLAMKESLELLEFLDIYNARRFFCVKYVPLFSINMIILPDDIGDINHKVILDRDEKKYNQFKSGYIIYQYK